MKVNFHGINILNARTCNFVLCALECCRLLAMTVLEIYNNIFISWAPVLRVIYSYIFNQPEMIHDQAKINFLVVTTGDSAKTILSAVNVRQ